MGTADRNEAVGQVGEAGGVLAIALLDADGRAIPEAFSAIAKLANAAQRVTTAFRALGQANIAQEFAAHCECEDAMLALDAALRAVGGAK